MKEYQINKNFIRVQAGDETLLVDIKEKDYGRSKKVLMVNSSCLHVLELLENNTESETIQIILGEKDHSCSDKELENNIHTTISLLVNEHVLIPKDSSLYEIGSMSDAEVIGFGPLKGKMGKMRKPLIGVVEITSECNCNCPHCYVKGLDKKKKISTDKFIQIANILKDKGIINVTITGGEPLSNPDFKVIYKAFKEQGFLIDVFTNALLIDKDLAAYFAAYPPRSLDITLYGTSNEEYERFTGVKDGYDLLCSALELLDENGIYYTIKMILNKMNYDHISEFNKIAYKHNAPFRYNVVIGQGNNTLKNPRELMLSNDQIIEVEKRDPVKIKAFRDLVYKCNCLPFDCNNESGWSQFLCGAGIDKVFIGYDGKMSPCMTLRNKGIDLFEYGYDYVWDYWGKQRKQKLSKEFKCITCKYLPICTPCTEEFEQANGNKEIPIENVCDLAEKRWNSFIEHNND